MMVQSFMNKRSLFGQVRTQILRVEREGSTPYHSFFRRFMGTLWEALFDSLQHFEIFGYFDTPQPKCDPAYIRCALTMSTNLNQSNKTSYLRLQFGL